MDEADIRMGKQKQKQSRSWVPLDESVKCTLTWSHAQLPTLYIDDYTILEEVLHLTELRKGDHCLVALNPLRKVSHWLDAFIMWLGTWELHRMFHHFTVMSDVVSINKRGVPCTRSGDPVTICEYSNVISKAWARARRVGLWTVLKDPAAFHELSLHDYTEVCLGNKGQIWGIFRVFKGGPGCFSEKDREATVQRCCKLMQSYEPYDFLWTNCESAAFLMSAATVGGGHTGRFVTPQVPRMLYTMLRFCLAVIGCACLCRMSTRAAGGPQSTMDSATAVALDLAFHLCATLPIALQCSIHLVRTAIYLTQQRQTIGSTWYFYLLTRECVRFLVVGLLSIGTVAVLPRLVWDYVGIWLAASIWALTAYFTVGLLFNVATQALLRFLRIVGLGVPILIFHDSKSSLLPPRNIAPPDSPSQKCCKIKTT